MRVDGLQIAGSGVFVKSGRRQAQMKNKALSCCSVQTWNTSVLGIGSVECGEQSARKRVVPVCVAVGVEKAHVGRCSSLAMVGHQRNSSPLCTTAERRESSQGKRP
jgi:hypothetical protein